MEGQTKKRVTLTGVVTSEPEIRATLKGKHTATFNLTSNTRRGGTREHSHMIVAYNDAAIEIRNLARQRSLPKGAILTIDGYVEVKEWVQKSSGEKKYLSHIVIDRFIFGEPAQATLQLAA